MVPTLTSAQVLARLQLDLANINARLASGVRDIRDNNRSTTFDLKVLQEERTRIEGVIATMAPDLGIAAPRQPRRLFAVQFGKGL